MLTNEYIQQIVVSRAIVSAERISTIKRALSSRMNQDFANTTSLITETIHSFGLVYPRTIDRDSVHARAELERAGEALSWWLNAIEAVWGLVSSGVVFQQGSSLTSFEPTILFKHSGGAYGESFRQLGQLSDYPTKLLRSRCETKAWLLSDPDLYLGQLLPVVPHEEVADALRESISCFRAELYLASVVMLGKASEGVWLELGSALLDALPAHRNAEAGIKRVRRDLEKPGVGFANKLKDLTNLYESNQVDFGALGRAARVDMDSF